ncbi:hypothetical protein MmiAt1_07750 [Methanimicrococcus sp. At1]|uniref:Uncharacterized protein n=1 Tax=Methanimicrococcus hacksteinii TaxID=3028293 RepID=A0ABU3VP80_9EURY|nr:hypothetical protein [Methanimicrococcus sp. At1]MDV0445218.1 hypothetical protein [Methanimicrococcus sp. At1]
MSRSNNQKDKPKILSKKVTITLSDESGYAAAAVLGNFLIFYQNLIYELGEYVSEGKSRQSGSFPENIKKDFKLETTGLRKGSAELDLQILDNQQTIDTLPSIKNLAINKANDIIIKLNNGADDVTDLLDDIEDTLRMKKAVNNIIEFWPDDNSDYTFSMKTEGYDEFKFNGHMKKNISRIQYSLKDVDESGKHQYFGRFIRIIGDQKRIMIDTLQGKRSFLYKDRDQKDLFSHLFQFIAIEENKNIIENFKPDSTFVMNDFITETNLKVIKPIPFELSFEDDVYIMQNDIFDIFSFHKDLKKARIDIEEQIRFLWSEYVSVDEKSLAPSGLVLRDLLLKYVGENYGLQMSKN